LIAETRSLSSSRPDDTRVIVGAFVAIAVFVGTWALLHFGLYTHHPILDTPVYQRYGNAMAHGEVPYRDFSIEYPPGALPVFALPGLAEPGHDQDVTPGFRHAFETIMWLCGAAVLGAIALAFVAVRAGPIRAWSALLFVALAPLALGSVILSRYDLWPTALMVAALAAFLWERPRTGSALLGVAVAAKLFPVVLIPLVLIYAVERYGRRTALACAAVIAAAVAIVFMPFVVLSPGGVWESLNGQLTRPLQIESLGAALLVAAHHAWGFGVAQETSHGSQNLAGHTPHVVAALSSVVQILALVTVWALYARSRRTGEGLLRYSAAALAVFVAFGKVLSPQFMIWLIPVVPLVRGRRGLAATGVLACALLLTQIEFPFRYWSYANSFGALPSWVVLARDLLLVVLAALLAYPRSRALPAQT
jgi:Glycosyltransferase family 87